MIAEPNSEIETWIRNELRPPGAYHVSRVSRDQILNSKLLQEQEFACIIYSCETFDEAELGFLRSLPLASYDSRIIILTSQISIYSYSQVHAMSNMVALQNPCDSRVFMTVLEKMSERQRFNFDVCPRFITNEPVRMIVLKSGLYIPTRMRNYSVSGAFLEYHGISLKVGDRIQLNLGAKDATKKADHMLVEAKVIWIRDGDNSRSPARGVGVQFMSEPRGEAQN